MPGLTPLRELIRRHRRIVAAACAGLAAVLALAVLRSPAAPAAAPAHPALDAGEVAVPVALASGAHARILSAGDVVDLVAVPRTGDRSAQIAVRDATVLSVAEGGFGVDDGAVIVLAVPRFTALRIADAGIDADFTAWVTDAMPRGAGADR